MGGLIVWAAAAGARSSSLRIQAAAYPAFLLLTAAAWFDMAIVPAALNLVWVIDAQSLGCKQFCFPHWPMARQLASVPCPWRLQGGRPAIDCSCSLFIVHWLPVARFMDTMGAAMLRCPSLAQLPPTLLSPAVLPDVLLYLWGCECWGGQRAFGVVGCLGARSVHAGGGWRHASLRAPPGGLALCRLPQHHLPVQLRGEWGSCTVPPCATEEEEQGMGARHPVAEQPAIGQLRSALICLRRASCLQP